jgi:hypothetical protein
VNWGVSFDYKGEQGQQNQPATVTDQGWLLRVDSDRFRSRATLAAKSILDYMIASVFLPFTIILISHGTYFMYIPGCVSTTDTSASFSSSPSSSTAAAAAAAIVCVYECLSLAALAEVHGLWIKTETTMSQHLLMFPFHGKKPAKAS